MFSKRHYEFLARFIAREMSVSDVERMAVIAGLARLLASELQRDNGKFDRARFLEAAQVSE